MDSCSGAKNARCSPNDFALKPNASKGDLLAEYLTIGPLRFVLIGRLRQAIQWA